MNQFRQQYARGLLLYEQKRCELAEKEFRQALVLNPESSETHAMLGLCLHYQGRFAQAKSEAEESIRLAPDFAFAHHTLSVVLSRGFNFERSLLDDLKLDDQIPFEIQRLIPNASSSHAVKAAGEAVRLQPENPDFLGKLALLRIWSGQFQEGMDIARQGLVRDPAHLDCLHAQILALAGLRQTTEVEMAAKQFLKLHPENPLGHNLTGLLKLHANQLQSAQEDFLESLRIDPVSHPVERTLLRARHIENRAKNLEILRGRKPVADPATRTSASEVPTEEQNSSLILPRLPVLLFILIAIGLLTLLGLKHFFMD